jgi:hypothetical protein
MEIFWIICWILIFIFGRNLWRNLFNSSERYNPGIKSKNTPNARGHICVTCKGTGWWFNPQAGYYHAGEARHFGEWQLCNNPYHNN